MFCGELRDRSPITLFVWRTGQLTQRYLCGPLRDSSLITLFVWRIGHLTHNVICVGIVQLTHNVICVENWTAQPCYLCGELESSPITLFVWIIAGQLTHNVICVEKWTAVSCGDRWCYKLVWRVWQVIRYVRCSRWLPTKPWWHDPQWPYRLIDLRGRHALHRH